MVDEPEKKVWLGLEYFCDEGDGMWTSDDNAFIQKAVSELVEIGVIESENAVLDSTLLRVKKAYPAYFGSYKDFGLVKTWLNGLENLWCIGRNGQHRYNNMDHSMATAMLACEHVLRGETDRGSNDYWGTMHCPGASGGCLCPPARKTRKNRLKGKAELPLDTRSP